MTPPIGKNQVHLQRKAKITLHPRTPSVFFFLLRHPGQRLHQCQLHRWLSSSERLHCHAGIPPRDLRGLLEDGLGAAHGQHYHDDQAGGEVTGKVEGGRGQRGRIRNSENQGHSALARCWWHVEVYAVSNNGKGVNIKYLRAHRLCIPSAVSQPQPVFELFVEEMLSSFGSSRKGTEPPVLSAVGCFPQSTMRRARVNLVEHD